MTAVLKVSAACEGFVHDQNLECAIVSCSEMFNTIILRNVPKGTVLLFLASGIKMVAVCANVFNNGLS